MNTGQIAICTKARFTTFSFYDLLSLEMVVKNEIQMHQHAHVSRLLTAYDTNGGCPIWLNFSKKAELSVDIRIFFFNFRIIYKLQSLQSLS